MKLRLFEFYFIKDYLRPWFGLIYSLFFLFFLGAIGYRITEGWDWGDCLWMVLITITTIGFGEVQTLSPEGRIITVLIIVGGLIFIQFTFQKAVRLFESGYFQRVNELRFKRILRKMENHVILCGYHFSAESDMFMKFCTARIHSPPCCKTITEFCIP